ncbi:MAG: NAD(P)/FAD-dependent oxidoreductase [Firmicutes bacterium]|nr:NAD(P)/FAD-dependent oxidoreductase [Bacillota bacterium]
MKERKTLYDIIVIGGGPAGFTAALYGGRADFSVLLIEEMVSGGQIASTAQVDNYPGFPDGIGGIELGQLLEKQARRFGAEVALTKAEEVKVSGNEKIVRTKDATYRGRSFFWTNEETCGRTCGGLK